MPSSSRFSSWVFGWTITLSIMFSGYLVHMLLETPDQIPAAAAGLLFLAFVGVIVGEMLSEVGH
jgi:ABC-type sulfate transport system permease component